jgi:O-antigen ligase
MEDAWALFLSNPFNGVGLGQIQVFSRSHRYAHSDLFEILATTGIVGTSIYLSIYVVLWKKMSRYLKTHRNQRSIYEINLLRSILICMVLIGLGRPNFLDLYAMFLLTTVVAYTHFLIHHDDPVQAPLIPIRKSFSRVRATADKWA